MVKLDPAFLDVLNCEHVRAYRENYMKYRMGLGKGAKGEVSDIPISQEDSRVPDELSEEIFGSSNSGNSTLYGELTRWRLGYRAFRKGEAQGSEGEISTLASKFTRNHLKLLPVAALSAMIAQLRPSDRDSKKIIPGKLHVHIGAGKLGCGLVIPSVIASGRRVVVLQRDSDTWAEAKALRAISLRVNGEMKMDFPLVHTELVKDAIKSTRDGDALLDSWFADSQGLLAAGFAGDELSTFLLERADSISVALGPAIKDCIGWLKPAREEGLKLLAPPVSSPGGSSIDRPVREVPIYCCENDHKAIAVLADEVDEQMNLWDPEMRVDEHHATAAIGTAANAANGKPVAPTAGGANATGVTNNSTTVTPVTASRSASMRNSSTDAAAAGDAPCPVIWRVYGCMVDRICSERDVEPHPELGGKVVIDVKAEAFDGQLVVLPASANHKLCPVPVKDCITVLPPFSGPHVSAPRTDAVGEYLSSRKVTLVNGLHTTLSFISILRREQDKNLPGRNPALNGKYQLADIPLLQLSDLDLSGLSSKSCTWSLDEPASDAKMLWLWAVARCLLVLFEHDMEVIITEFKDKVAASVENDKGGHFYTPSKPKDGEPEYMPALRSLLSYAQVALTRVLSQPDSTKRVLGGGVIERFKGRLETTEGNLNQTPSPLQAQLRDLIREARVNEKDLRAVVHAFVSQVRKDVIAAPAGLKNLV